MASWWQYIYILFDPIAFSIGPFTLYWYALFFLLGVAVVFFLSHAFFQKKPEPILVPSEYRDFSFWLLVGTLVGARLGYAFFYFPDFFWENPWALVWPFDLESRVWTGLSGMSYHGGVLGLGLALYLYTRQKKKDFLKLADALALAAPLGVFFGRLGNFFNQELPGRLTTLPWGIHFPGLEPVSLLRHPVTLYEAFGEGLGLFFLLYCLRRFHLRPGVILIVYLVGSSLIRFTLEFFRAPDPQLGFLAFGLTLGQYFSIGMLCLSLLAWFFREKYATMKNV